MPSIERTPLTYGFNYKPYSPIYISPIICCWSPYFVDYRCGLIHILWIIDDTFHVDICFCAGTPVYTSVGMCTHNISSVVPQHQATIFLLCVLLLLFFSSFF